jgi:hypothetical protein
VTHPKDSKNRGRRLLATAFLLTFCIAAPVLTGGLKPAGSEVMGSPLPSCFPVGAVRECRDAANGRGIQHCIGAQWSPCMFGDERQPEGQTGTVHPKFYVLTVVYAPPGTTGGGSSSSVTYGSGSTTGTTVTSGSSFKHTHSVSVSTSAGFLGNGGSVGASFAYGRNRSNTKAIDIKKSATTEISDSGPSSDGIDHDRDIIYLWLNPSVQLTLSPTSASWKLTETATADIQFLFVGWLKNPSLIPPGVAQRLQARGITAQDFPIILSADPFANGGTPIDRRRYQIMNTTFPYEPPFAEGERGPTFRFVLSNSNTGTTTSSLQKDYTLGAEVSGSLSFLGLCKASFKNQNSWTWSSTNTNATTNGTSESASVIVGGPSFGYTGPTDIAAYYDTLYKTFMFVPVGGAIPALRGSVKSAAGRPAVGKEVTVVANGVKYRTFTNAKGDYRVYGRISGPLRLKVGVTQKSLPGVPASREANLTVQ